MPLKVSLYNTVLYIANISNTTLPMNSFLYWLVVFQNFCREKIYFYSLKISLHYKLFYFSYGLPA